MFQLEVVQVDAGPLGGALVDHALAELHLCSGSVKGREGAKERRASKSLHTKRPENALTKLDLCQGSLYSLYTILQL